MWKHVLPLTLTVAALMVQAQSQSVPMQPTQFQQRAIANGAEVHRPIETNWGNQQQQLERMQITNSFNERQVALRRDTEKLLSLAAELKQNVDKTGTNILSMDVVKKAQEIEKLAKSVKDKMKNAY
jgi:hypothetical protein